MTEEPKEETSRAVANAPRKPLQVLDARGKRLVELMVFGAESEEAALAGADPWTPLSLETAAPLAGLKIRNARFIFSQPIFLKEYSAALASMRSGHKARAVGVLAAILDDPGENTAADRKVRIDAAKTLLGDEARAPAVNVSVGVGVQLTAGIVVRLPPTTKPAPSELQPTPGPLLELTRSASTTIPTVAPPEGSLDD